MIQYSSLLVNHSFSRIHNNIIIVKSVWWIFSACHNCRLVFGRRTELYQGRLKIDALLIENKLMSALEHPVVLENVYCQYLNNAGKLVPYMRQDELLIGVPSYPNMQRARQDAERTRPEVFLTKLQHSVQCGRFSQTFIRLNFNCYSKHRK